MKDTSTKAKEPLDIEKLKEKYQELKKRYSLPEFKFLNDNFEIENIDSESELILKAIRKHITEKIFFVLRSLEMFMNPQNAPLFVFNFLKSFTESEKDRIKQLYDKVSGYEIEAFGLEAGYEETKEAAFIKKSCEDWKGISEELTKIYSIMKVNHGKDSRKQEKSYFG
jgi:hypothetical protein